MTALPAPKRVELPIEGGESGATVRLHPLLTGEMLSPPGLMGTNRSGFGALRQMGIGLPRRRWIWVPIPAFLIEHRKAGTLLVDTGLHPSIASGARENMGRFGQRVYRFRIEADQAVREQLRQRQVDPDAIDTIIMTHLHIDHASALACFPAARALVDEREWKTASNSRSPLNGYYRPHLAALAQWETLSYAATATPWKQFDHTIDLFGDGSVRLLSTPGHTLGHQSLLLRLRDRFALLCGDAAYLRATIDESLLPPRTANREQFDQSLRQIKAFVAAHRDALVIPGHDAQAWAALDSCYE